MVLIFVPQAIIEFVDEGGNLIIAGNSEATDLVRELATEVGVEMDEEQAAVIDHLNYDTALDDGQVRRRVLGAGTEESAGSRYEVPGACIARKIMSQWQVWGAEAVIHVYTKN